MFPNIYGSVSLKEWGFGQLQLKIILFMPHDQLFLDSKKI